MKSRWKHMDTGYIGIGSMDGHWMMDERKDGWMAGQVFG